jgi:hypothetical protein
MPVTSIVFLDRHRSQPGRNLTEFTTPTHCEDAHPASIGGMPWHAQGSECLNKTDFWAKYRSYLIANDGHNSLN